ncbi:hypothetical protein H4S06_000387 [Coemansia sp. BCRC 34490]|nr:hypothetical protein H4S06_000387 [Coemansia sp. BCRC 34490]
MARLFQLIRDAHPLCADKDLQDMMSECITKTNNYQEQVSQQQAKIDPQGFRPPVQFPQQQQQMQMQQQQGPPHYPQQPFSDQQQQQQQLVALNMPPSNYPTLQNNGLSNVVILSKGQPMSHNIFSTEDPASMLASRWTDDEIERLQDYLTNTQGRKDWTKCARYVGTKSNAQCKAKYNNMRASERARDVFAL